MAVRLPARLFQSRTRSAARAGRRVRRAPSEDRRPPAAHEGYRRRPACRPPARGRGLSRRARAAPARRRVSRAHRRPALGALSALSRPHALGGDHPVCGRPGMPGAARLPAGLAIETEPVGGETCLFRTAYPLTLWPVEIEAVRLSGMPLPAPAKSDRRGSRRLPAHQPALQQSRHDLHPARPRSAALLPGAANTARALLELLLAHTISVALADDHADAHPVILPPDTLQAGRLRAGRGAVPLAGRGRSPAFACSASISPPAKSSCSSTSAGSTPRRCVSAGNRMEIFVYLDRAVPELERSVQASSLALGCTPIVNLFEQRCEPIPLDHTSIEYRIEPDVRRPASLEVWSVERVRESLPDGEFRTWEPFHRLTRQRRRRRGGRADRRLLRHRPPRDHRRPARHRGLPAAA